MALLLVVACIVAVQADRPQLSQLEDLNKASEAGAGAQESSDRLATNLSRVARRIARAERLGDQSHAIERLTLEQRASLVRLRRVVVRQFGSLARAVALIERLEADSDALNSQSERQAALLTQTLTSLRALRRLAGGARSATMRLTERARYGALLAEDSARAFSSR